MENSSLKYNFILIHGGTDYYRVSCSDLESRKDVKIFYELGADHPSVLDKLLFAVQKSSKMDKFFEMPFGKRWQKKFENIKFEDTEKPLCFVMNAGLFSSRFGHNFLRYMHQKYPSAKFVGFYADLVKTKPINGQPKVLLPFFDLMLSYDKDDSAKYGFAYHPTFFSDFKAKDNPQIHECDVYFVGAAKDRLPLIFSAYNQCVKANLKCDFYLTNVSKKNRLLLSGIHYIKRNMPYVENLEHVIKSRCILEILQQGANGATFRLWEAINYNKAIITNNESILGSKFYDKRYVSVFNRTEDFNTYFIKEFVPFENVFKKDIRPICFLKFIQDNL